MSETVYLRRDNFIIRKATLEDAVAIRKMVFKTFVEYGIAADPDDDDRDIMCFGVPKENVVELVTVFDGNPVGSAILTACGEGRVKLTKFYLDKNYRRFGAGVAMLNTAVAAAKSMGVREVFLKTRALYKEAVQLYESTGWVRGADQPGPGPERLYSIRFSQE
ncbi:hypothetical protein AOA59_05355 [Pseudomonas sp. 2822-15]|uniref:GNAT family N-acetyltransferase n=1 Tax=Pseudomonas sp. 2822-15 TaxID=1712677 RepID=UPI000C152D42|nr:GNAT family N-acetyltransferase [Pseudomonas sp. 2822-15]PIB45967.1 hypothetical protein AOA59_05355 [Pseudomonas sp. 2822-15]